MPTTRLSPEAIQEMLAEHPLWSFSDERGGLLKRSFRFESFQAAFAFMTKMAEVSESIDHHPEWFNVYNRVDVTLTTHDLGGLSSKDLAWVQSADQAVWNAKT
jgi:4a-hydroxytetrahydrobiopterin dehydratase